MGLSPRWALVVGVFCLHTADAPASRAIHISRRNASDRSQQAASRQGRRPRRDAYRRDLRSIERLRSRRLATIPASDASSWDDAPRRFPSVALMSSSSASRAAASQREAVDWLTANIFPIL